MTVYLRLDIAKFPKSGQARSRSGGARPGHVWPVGNLGGPLCPIPPGVSDRPKLHLKNACSVIGPAIGIPERALSRRVKGKAGRTFLQHSLGPRERPLLDYCS